MTSSADGQDRLQEIWAAWSLTPDETMSKAQLGALDAVAKWLEAGQTDPEVMIRAVQLLLADPERPDARQRASWKSLRKAVQENWTNAGTFRDHFSYGQALVLAAWPDEPDGWLNRSALLDSGWELRRGQEPKEIAKWCDRQPQSQPVEDAHTKPESKSGIALAEPTLTQLFGITPFDSKAVLLKISNNGGQTTDYFAVGADISTILTKHEEAFAALSESTVVAASDIKQIASALNAVKAHVDTAPRLIRTEVERVLGSTHSKLNLLWWGQSRYCRALRKPYLRLKSDSAALLWWTAREAAELSLSVDVEPAAAYLVETLHNLDQNIDEKKPVLEWMKELDGTLKQAGDKVLPLSGRLDKIAKEDALGLPVTWVRRRRMLKDDFNDEAAKNDVALNLDEEIDRGDWASWVFRETLLDLHLREEKP